MKNRRKEKERINTQTEENTEADLEKFIEAFESIYSCYGSSSQREGSLSAYCQCGLHGWGKSTSQTHDVFLRYNTLFWY